jgi:hypothetical protein
VGKKHPIHSRRLAAELGIKEGDTFIRTRGIIASVVKDRGLAVGALGRGYFIISNDEELFEYLGSLDSRIREIDNRKEWVSANYAKLHGEPELGEEDEV